MPLIRPRDAEGMLELLDEVWRGDITDPIGEHIRMEENTSGDLRSYFLNHFQEELHSTEEKKTWDEQDVLDEIDRLNELYIDAWSIDCPREWEDTVSKFTVELQPLQGDE